MCTLLTTLYPTIIPNTLIKKSICILKAEEGFTNLTGAMFPIFKYPFSEKRGKIK